MFALTAMAIQAPSQQLLSAAAATAAGHGSAPLPDAPSTTLLGDPAQQTGGSSSLANGTSAAATPSTSTSAQAASQTRRTPVAPGTSVIVGDVVDSHNDLVPGAQVTATQVLPGAAAAPAATQGAAPSAQKPESWQVIADSAGHFELRGLTPGTWTVSVTAPGLSTFVSPRTVLRAGDRFELQGVVLTIPEQHADVTVTMTLEQVAEQEIHDEEHQRVLAVFPNYNTSYVWNAAPLNARQKFQLSAKSTFDPMSFLTAGIVASLEQAHGDFPEFGPGAGGFGKRYAAAWGTTFIGHTIGFAVLPSLLRQDPRYFYMGTGSKRTRAIHAIASSFLCRGNSGHTQFNTSHIAGNFIAGYIARAYYPGQNNSFTLAVDNTLIGIAGTSGVNLFREFWLKRLSSGTPKFGTGKPEGEVTAASHP